jgi:hypothetical protein
LFIVEILQERREFLDSGTDVIPGLYFVGVSHEDSLELRRGTVAVELRCGTVGVAKAPSRLNAFIGVTRL